MSDNEASNGDAAHSDGFVESARDSFPMTDLPDDVDAEKPDEEINNDKDVQLEYDTFDREETAGEPAKDAQMDSPEGNLPSPDSPAVSPKKAVINEADDEVDPSSQPTNLDADMIFGSDHSDDDDDKPAPAVNEEKNESPAAKEGEDDDDKMSRTGSIKSDAGDDKISDFDIMMGKKREERRKAFRRKKRQDVDLINDHDERIQELIAEMKAAADKDRKSHEKRECATSKITMLPRVVNILRKHDLQTAFLDCGILSALADWLAPLSDGNLTHVKIRESILKILEDMSTISPEQLKNSGIGKAVMLLYKHPKELKENRSKAGKLIQEWSRPIFGTSTNYRSMSREEREERDMDMNKRRLSVTEDDQGSDNDGDEYSTPVAKKKRRSEPARAAGTPEDDPNKDVPRARVPQPSLRDYVVRPKSSIESVENPGGRRTQNAKSVNRFEKRIRGMKDMQRSAKGPKTGHVSLEGRKL